MSREDGRLGGGRRALWERPVGRGLDIIVNEDSLSITDVTPLRFIKFDFEGNQLYTWLIPREFPDGGR